MLCKCRSYLINPRAVYNDGIPRRPTIGWLQRERAADIGYKYMTLDPSWRIRVACLSKRYRLRKLILLHLIHEYFIPNMLLSNVLLYFAALTLASPAPADHIILKKCGYPIGNCYENGCDGHLSQDKITCIGGHYMGCPCGYKCGRNIGKCNENGCKGREGRCTVNYRGCSCI
ncbi:hypothetical protein VTO42DRAFT_7900 [Malbranchea cinnamomea]